ncbi:MAG TPA: zinc-binding dehydrogenase [Solirubrobacteraceae bacterium]|nr:zinc-binding dehydrogenase [Solirubrobacteraceae bacterium]
MISNTWVKAPSGELERRELELADPRDHEVLLAVRLATVCGSDIHFLEDFPLQRGTDYQAMGHEAVGVVAAAGSGVRGVKEGDRAIASCLYGCGACRNCQRGQVGICERYGRLPGMSNILAGCQGEAFLVPHADVNVVRVPDELSDEAAILATDIMSTGFAAVERGGLRAGDTVAVFAQGPVGLCATAGARALGAGLIIAVERVPERVEMSKRLGADVVLDPQDALEGIRELTGKRGVDVAIEALGHRDTFAAALAAARLDGTVSSVGVYGQDRSLELPVGPAFYQRRIVTSMCPCGTDRLQALLAILRGGRTGLEALFTHHLPISRTDEAYELFRHRRDGAIKIGLVPG